MLPRRERLTRAEFTSFFSKGKRYNSPHLVLIMSPASLFQASAVISKKIAKTAVLRNKFRRRVYAVFEAERKSGLSKGVFICIAKDKAATLSFEALREELHALIHKTGIIG